MTILITALATVTAALIAALVALYLKRIERINAVEERLSSARETAYDTIIAAGDVAWLTRTEVADSNPKIVIPEPEKVGEAANQLFQVGLDRLKDNSRDFEAEKPYLLAWFNASFDEMTLMPESFERFRDQISNRRRLEIGLRRKLVERDASLFERLQQGERFDKLPTGIHQVLYMEDGGWTAQGGGDDFINLMMQAIHLPSELRDSRQRALTRVQEAEKREIWVWPDGVSPIVRDVDDGSQSEGQV